MVAPTGMTTSLISLGHTGFIGGFQIGGNCRHRASRSQSNKRRRDNVAPETPHSFASGGNKDIKGKGDKEIQNGCRVIQDHCSGV